MEQLVHLRLKSIYKAFQQSARNNDAHPHLKRAALAAMKNSSKHGEPKIDPVQAKAQADAAAAELLAELEEEEQQQRHSTSTKSSKKKRKKKKKMKVGGVNYQETKHREKERVSQGKRLSVEHSGRAEEKNKKQIEKKAVVKKLLEYNATKNNFCDQQMKVFPEKIDKNTPVSQHEVKAKTSRQELLAQHQTDPMQTKLCELVSERDLNGIEELLEKWKGVPGKGVLRKNAKKALKRLRDSGNSNKKQLLKIISTTPKTSTTQETILEMGSSIVGHVIGKEGQKIRALMEESGAKVWIDRDSMQAQEPRIVYVSGAKKAVNIAVKMIQDSVKQIIANQQEKEKSNRIIDNGKDSSVCICEEITCDPRFVPLLIGRRGWNIKQIQDGSGAKVDIDQSVTPRIIIVTGTVESVQDAKRLISDVLAYPHAQLNTQPKVETDIDAEVFRSDGKHSPPPSKFITMGGDIKSTISASSSLSSTPEPSTASSNKDREVIPPPPGMFENTNIASGSLAQRYAHTPSYYNNNFGQQQSFNDLKQILPFQQQQASKLPHIQPNVGMVGNVQQHRGSMIGQHQHQQAMHLHGSLSSRQVQQPAIHPHRIHSNHGIVSSHERVMQQQHLQQHKKCPSFLSDRNFDERGSSCAGGLGKIGQMHYTTSIGQQQNESNMPATLFSGGNESRLLHLQRNQRTWLTPGFQERQNQYSEGIVSDRKSKNITTDLLFHSPVIESQTLPLSLSTCPSSVDISGGLLPTTSALQDESNLIERMFGPSNLGMDPESMLLASLNSLDVGSSEVHGW
eukprot:CAMPEP_0194157132 /NCGR_PEP_ID=MMETSP0152-20130528/70785_1 /TAXON_ID=1049557 /ORGANISM="Thalassiothrix antarctica, Strain L6-D1" /LENGTH=792 /DNA_ID=CAMNT_0038865301 /DNA_START=594 /DNA_END=2969 /DNA_ORIENTATION=+